MFLRIWIVWKWRRSSYSIENVTIHAIHHIKNVFRVGKHFSRMDALSIRLSTHYSQKNTATQVLHDVYHPGTAVISLHFSWKGIEKLWNVLLIFKTRNRSKKLAYLLSGLIRRIISTSSIEILFKWTFGQLRCIANTIWSHALCGAIRYSSDHDAL